MPGAAKSQRPKDRAAPEESAGAKGFAELAEVPGSAPQTDSDGHKSCGAGRISSATMNSDLPEGSAGPGAEEDAESARDAGAARDAEAAAEAVFVVIPAGANGAAGSAAQAGAEGTEGPGRAPPQAGGNRPAETTV